MSLLELKLTLLEDVLKKNEDRWRNEYVRANWPFEPFLKLLETKALVSLTHRVDKTFKRGKYVRSSEI